jgi:dihydroorotase
MYDGPKIDTHDHCRDGDGQEHIATIGEVMTIANLFNFVAICDMPNKNPAVTTENQVHDYVRRANAQGVRGGYYAYIGVTPDKDQQIEAFRIARENPIVVGMKGATTEMAELTFETYDEQSALFYNMANRGYNGPVTMHCEDNCLFDMSKWDPKRPWTWNLARPPVSALAATERLIKLARKWRFEGTLIIPHASTAEEIKAIRAHNGDGVNLAFEVTPHHFLLSTDDMERLGRSGLRYKINPPVRDPETVEAYRNEVLDCMGYDNIMFGSDHAPHRFIDKFVENYMSGHPSLVHSDRLFYELERLGVSDRDMEMFTYSNAKRVFPKILE